MLHLLWVFADWWAQTLDVFALGGLVASVLIFAVAPAAVLMHECGHALPALVLTRGAVDMHVGSDGPGLRVRAGRFAMTLQAASAPGEVRAGWVRFRPERIGPTAAVFAGGPAASLLGGTGAAALVTHLDPSGLAARACAAFALASFIGGLENLLASHGGRSDGAKLRVLWRLSRRGAPGRRDPNASTSVPPPGR
jgi:hypothetical protein